MNVLTLNNAGSNLYLFSCPTTQSLLAWTAALRLAAWEKSRLEEIYTAHLIRITLNDGVCIGVIALYIPHILQGRILPRRCITAAWRAG